MIVICPDCGSYMEFDPYEGIWFCPWCGYEENDIIY